MTLIVDRTRDLGTHGEDRTLEAPEPRRRRIDVTDLHAAGIEGFVESSVDTDCVSLEHRGGRTYLVVDE